MNGRLYDPVISRFISADPYVQDPTDTQGTNRYSYVGNNPLNTVDPSGFIAMKVQMYQRNDHWESGQDRWGKSGSGCIKGPGGGCMLGIDGPWKPWMGLRFNGSSPEENNSRAVPQLDAVEVIGVREKLTELSAGGVFTSFWQNGVRDFINNNKGGDYAYYGRLARWLDPQVPVPTESINNSVANAIKLAPDLMGVAGVGKSALKLGKRNGQGTLQGKTVYHYKDSAGAKGIAESGVIRPDAKGRVFVTHEKLSPSDAQDRLFIQQSSKGSHVVEIQAVEGLVLNAGKNARELIHQGSIRDGRHGIFTVKPNE